MKEAKGSSGNFIFDFFKVITGSHRSPSSFDVDVLIWRSNVRVARAERFFQDYGRFDQDDADRDAILEQIEWLWAIHDDTEDQTTRNDTIELIEELLKIYDDILLKKKPSKRR